MTGNEYQHEAMRTASGKCRNLSNCGLGLTGEAGEVADCIKKYLYQGHSLSGKHIMEELGDVLWYAAVCAHMVGYSLDEVMNNNVCKLRKRYPDGFSEKCSVCRDDTELSSMLERNAEIAHNQWAGWMKYLFSKSTKNDDGTVTIPRWAVDRWTRQAHTLYENLSEEEKVSDRAEAKKYIN